MMGKAKQLAEDVDIEADDDLERGDVVTLPNYSAIPEPFIPLGKEGQRAYETWCRDLIQIGALTSISRGYAESVGVAVDEIIAAKARGKGSRGATELMRSSTLKLEKFIGSKPITGPGRGESPYTAFGFAKRARQRRHSND